MTALFDPLATIGALNRNGVECIVIGECAAVAHGSSDQRALIEICPSPASGNLARLAEALHELDAHSRERDAPLEFAALAASDTVRLDTRFGAMDCIGRPPGTEGFEDLRRAAIDVDVEGTRILFAGLDDLIRIKQAGSFPLDRLAAASLVELKQAT